MFHERPSQCKVVFKEWPHAKAAKDAKEKASNSRQVLDRASPLAQSRTLSRIETVTDVAF
jgi:hypothetical protein